PADVQSRGDMCPRPIKNHSNLIPVTHLFELHHLYRRTCNDHTVVKLIFHFIKPSVKHLEVLLGCIFGSMCIQTHKANLDLQRVVGKEPDKVSFRRYFQRHEIQDKHPQWTDVLRIGTQITHHKYILLFQEVNRWQIIWYLYWHKILVCYAVVK